MIDEQAARRTLFPGAITRTRRRKLTAAAVALAVVGTPALVGSASAAIQDPPPAPFEVVIFPERDFVMVGGFAPGLKLDFRIVRNGVTIGNASSNDVSPALLTDADGILEVNHPGGLCWVGVTPNILPGDRLVAVESGTTNGVATTTQNVTATAAVDDGTNVVVHGTARNANGTPMALSKIEQRIVNPAFRVAPDALARRDIRATTADGNLRRDPAVAGGFIATHGGLSPANRQKAVDGNIRTLGWQAVDGAGNRLGITIFEVGEPGGPGMGGCAPRRDYAVTAFNRQAVRVGTTGLSVGGTALDASSVTVTLRDRSAATSNPAVMATLSRATGVQTFRASFTARQLRRLADGTLTAVGSYTTGGGTIGGLNKSIIKDMRIPRAPTSDTRTGFYKRAQSVILSLRRGESASSRIYYTTDRRRPTANSLRFVRPIRVTSTKTLRAIVVDRAGNRSVSNCATGQGCWRIAIR